MRSEVAPSQLGVLERLDRIEAVLRFIARAVAAIILYLIRKALLSK